MSQQRKPTAVQKRADNKDALAPFALSNLWSRLPLSFPLDPDLPPSPKPRYRSQYRYLDAEGLKDSQVLETLSSFDVALRLIDYAHLEPLLAAHIYVPSAKGQTPFHPVSLYLLRAFRWQYLLLPLGRPRFPLVFKTTVIGFAASTLLPARAGEVVIIDKPEQTQAQVRIGELPEQLAQALWHPLDHDDHDHCASWTECAPAIADDLRDHLPLDLRRLELREGETHAVIGPNGAGKTTLISQLAGNLRPDSGSIRFAGEDVTHLSAPARAHKYVKVREGDDVSIGAVIATKGLLASGRVVVGRRRQVLVVRSQRRVMASGPRKDVGAQPQDRGRRVPTCRVIPRACSSTG